MTKKLKLPLLIGVSTGNKYTLSKSVHSGMIDLTGSEDGATYGAHCTETTALSFLESGAWTVVGSPSNELTAVKARVNVTLAEQGYAEAQTTFNAAIANLEKAKSALEVATKPYLV